MILALDFCGSAFTGIQWVLYDPGGLWVNTSLRFFFFFFGNLCFVLSVVGLVGLAVCCISSCYIFFFLGTLCFLCWLVKVWVPQLLLG